MTEERWDEGGPFEISGAATGFLCPKCDSKNTRWVHRSGWKHVLRLIDIRALWCKDCGHRFYRRR